MKIFTIDLKFLGRQDTIACFLIDAGGTLALIETGPESTYLYLCAQISNLGYEVSDIKKVFVTHVHLDHAGAAWRFAALGATIYVHPAGAPHLANPEKLYRSAQRIYHEDMERLWGMLEPIPVGQLHVVEHMEIVPLANTKMQALHTPGHAVHHVAWLIQGHLFCGDVAGVKINGGPVVPPCPPPDIDLDAWFASVKIIANCAAKCLYLTHFGVVENKLAHLEELVAILRKWTDWMYPFAKAATPDNEVIVLFEQYCNEYYVNYGLTENEISAYEHANPSFMSVAGLLRYWKLTGLAGG